MSVALGKSVNAEFYKGVMDRLLKRILRVSPVAFVSRDFSFCTTICPPTKLQVFDNFWPKNMFQNFITHVLSRLSPPDNFLFPKLKMKLKWLHFADVAEIQDAVADELKKAQNEEFWAAFQKLYDRTKACVYANGAYSEWKEEMCLPNVSSNCKKISLKSLDRCVYILLCIGTDFKQTARTRIVLVWEEMRFSNRPAACCCEYIRCYMQLKLSWPVGQ